MNKIYHGLCDLKKLNISWYLFQYFKGSLVGNIVILAFPFDFFELFIESSQWKIIFF